MFIHPICHGIGCVTLVNAGIIDIVTEMSHIVCRWNISKKYRTIRKFYSGNIRHLNRE